MTRVLQPELLDELAPDDPEAMRSRGDLRRVNWWMGHRRILLNALNATPLPHVQRIAELGAGDGTLALQLAKQQHIHWPKVEITLVDRQPVVTSPTLQAFQNLGWHPRVVQADVFDWLAAESSKADIIFVNLFLHHFDEPRLRQLLRTICARCSCFIALEPRRHPLARAGCELLWAIGCNRVTRHDARLSVQAGFHGRELSHLWPESNWTISEQPAGMFSHLFVATRPSP